MRKYASEEALRNLRDPTEVSSSSESSMSDYSEDEAQVNAPSPTRPETNDDSQRMQAVDLSLKGAEGGNTSSASTLVDTGRQMTSYGRSPSPNSNSSNSGNRSPTSAAVARFKVQPFLTYLTTSFSSWLPFLRAEFTSITSLTETGTFCR